MKESIIAAILGACSVVLAVAAGIGNFITDREAPVIKLEGKNNLTYTEGMSNDTLLENMTAVDDKDGDVTESLRVSNLYVISEDKAMVVYVAKDQANNVAKLKRRVRYKAAEPSVETEQDLEDDTQNSNDVQEPETTVEPGQRIPDTEPQDETGTPAGPRIMMIQNEVTLKVGETFNVLRYIQSAVDADGTNLSRSVHVDGVYDMSQPGVYEIRVYATNTTGVSSNIETITLKVEP